MEKLYYVHRVHAYHFKLNICVLREITLTEIRFHTLHAWNQNFFRNGVRWLFEFARGGSEHIFGNFIIQILKIRSSQNCRETILIIIEIKALSKLKEEKVRFKKIVTFS